MLQSCGSLEGILDWPCYIWLAYIGSLHDANQFLSSCDFPHLFSIVLFHVSIFSNRRQFLYNKKHRYKSTKQSIFPVMFISTKLTNRKEVTKLSGLYISIFNEIHRFAYAVISLKRNMTLSYCTSSTCSPWVVKQTNCSILGRTCYPNTSRTPSFIMDSSIYMDYL